MDAKNMCTGMYSTLLGIKRLATTKATLGMLHSMEAAECRCVLCGTWQSCDAKAGGCAILVLTQDCTAGKQIHDCQIITLVNSPYNTQTDCMKQSTRMKIYCQVLSHTGVLSCIANAGNFYLQPPQELFALGRPCCQPQTGHQPKSSGHSPQFWGSRQDEASCIYCCFRPEGT